MKTIIIRVLCVILLFGACSCNKVTENMPNGNSKYLYDTLDAEIAYFIEYAEKPKLLLISTYTVSSEWIFPDGSSSSGNVVEKYLDSISDYTVSLVVSNSSGSDTVTEVISFTEPEKEYILDGKAWYYKGSNCEPAQLKFHIADAYLGNYTYSWDFGDLNSGADNTSYLAECVHVYTEGLYTIHLIITDSVGGQVYNGSDQIKVYATPGIGFYAIPETTLLLDGEVEFYEQSSLLESGHWYFGDGAIAVTSYNIIEHTYKSVGSYEVIHVGSSVYGCIDYNTNTVEIRY